ARLSLRRAPIQYSSGWGPPAAGRALDPWSLAGDRRGSLADHSLLAATKAPVACADRAVKARGASEVLVFVFGLNAAMRTPCCGIKTMDNEGCSLRRHYVFLAHCPFFPGVFLWRRPWPFGLP